MCIFLTSPFGREVALQGRVRGPSPHAAYGKGPLTRPKTVDLSPRGRGEDGMEYAS
ncbi:hypothetical protein ABIE28_002401 [Devosia sp. 2618]